MFCFGFPLFWSKTLQRCPRTRPRTKKQGTKPLLYTLEFFSDLFQVLGQFWICLNYFYRYCMVEMWPNQCCIFILGHPTMARQWRVGLKIPNSHMQLLKITGSLPFIVRLLLLFLWSKVKFIKPWCFDVRNTDDVSYICIAAF